MTEAGAIALALSLSEPQVARDDERLCLHVTGSTETPLPMGIAPTALMDAGTGSLKVADSPGDLVRSASTYLQALAVLPINPDDDALVDRLVSERVAGTTKKRALRRR